MMVVNLFDQGVQTLEAFRLLTSVRLSAQDRGALRQAFADPERAPDLKVRDATDQTYKLGALAQEVSRARTKHRNGKPTLHPRLREVFADQLSRKNPVASLADFERQQAILREKARELTVLQEAVKTDSEKVPERDEARRALVAGIRDALSGGIEGQLEKLLADPVTKAAVDSCHSLWQEILNDSVDVDDAVVQVTFEQVQETTQAAVEALEAWETRHGTSAARKHTEAAIDALDKSTKRLGIQPTSILALRHPEKTKDIVKELEELEEALEAEHDALTSVDPMADAPLEDVRRALASAILYYTRTVTNKVSGLQTAVKDLTTLLDDHVPGLTAPDTSRLTEIIRRSRHEDETSGACEEAQCDNVQDQAKMANRKGELDEISNLNKRDIEVQRERMNLLHHAEKHYPELFLDEKWLRTIGIIRNAPPELSRLGVCDWCVICHDVYPINEGASCVDGHFTCKECLSGSVRAATHPNAHVMVLQDGSMCCVVPDCGLIISGRAIASAIPDQDFQNLIDIVRKHIERDTAAEQELHLQRRLDAALRDHARGKRLRQYMVEHLQNAALRTSVVEKLRPLLTPDIVGEDFNIVNMVTSNFQSALRRMLELMGQSGDLLMRATTSTGIDLRDDAHNDQDTIEQACETIGVDNATPIASNDSQAMISLRDGRSDMPEYALAEHHVLPAKPQGWARRPHHGSTYGSDYMGPYRERVEELLELG
ncbi:Hypothetical Protein FCC1311_112952, partial [Hondaea fermentalgiana]